MRRKKSEVNYWGHCCSKVTKSICQSALLHYRSCASSHFLLQIHFKCNYLDKKNPESKFQSVRLHLCFSNSGVRRGMGSMSKWLTAEDETALIIEKMNNAENNGETLDFTEWDVFWLRWNAIFITLWCATPHWSEHRTRTEACFKALLKVTDTDLLLSCILAYWATD